MGKKRTLLNWGLAVELVVAAVVVLIFAWLKSS